MKLRMIVILIAGIALSSPMVEAKGGCGGGKGKQGQAQKKAGGQCAEDGGKSQKGSGQCAEEGEKTQKQERVRKQEAKNGGSSD